MQFPVLGEHRVHVHDQDRRGQTVLEQRLDAAAGDRPNNLCRSNLGEREWTLNQCRPPWESLPGLTRFQRESGHQADRT
jgi:hypothetical protein